MVKIVDVAREAGVSVATVSRALNDHPTVRADLAQRVRSAAHELGYRPNGVARGLRRRSTDVLALIISDVSDPFFTAVTRGAEDVAQRNGYSVLLCNADEDSAKEAGYLRVARQQQVAGVLLSPHIAGSDISELVAASIPLVVVDRPIDDDVDSVLVDSRTGAREATRHLLDAGWERPACITGPRDAATAVERLAGYRDAMAASPRPAVLVEHAPFRHEGGAQAAARLLARPAPPDSFFVANAQMALGVLAELERRRLRAGRDVGIIMFDDPPWAPFVSPPVSVVQQPAYEIGERAMELLVDRIKGDAPREARHLRLTTRVVLRESSRRTTR